MIMFHSFLLLCYISQSWALWYLLLYKLPNAAASDETTPSAFEKLLPERSTTAIPTCYVMSITNTSNHLQNIQNFITTAEPLMKDYFKEYHTKFVSIGPDYFMNGDKGQDVYAYNRAVGECTNGHFGHLPYLTSSLLQTLKKTPNILRNKTASFWIHTEYDSTSESFLYPDGSKLIYYDSEVTYKSTTDLSQPEEGKCLTLQMAEEKIVPIACASFVSTICQRSRADVQNYHRLLDLAPQIAFYTTFKPEIQLKNQVRQWHKGDASCATLPTECSQLEKMDLLHLFPFQFDNAWTPSSATATKTPSQITRLTYTLEDALSDYETFRLMDYDELVNTFRINYGWPHVQVQSCDDYLLLYQTSAPSSQQTPYPPTEQDDDEESGSDLANLTLEVGQTTGLLVLFGILFATCIAKKCGCGKKKRPREEEESDDDRQPKPKKSKWRHLIRCLKCDCFRCCCCKRKKKKQTTPAKEADPFLDKTSSSKKSTLKKIKSLLSLDSKDETPPTSRRRSSAAPFTPSDIESLEHYYMEMSELAAESRGDSRYEGPTVRTTTPHGTPIIIHRYPPCRKHHDYHQSDDSSTDMSN